MFYILDGAAKIDKKMQNAKIFSILLRFDISFLYNFTQNERKLHITRTGMRVSACKTTDQRNVFRRSSHAPREALTL